MLARLPKWDLERSLISNPKLTKTTVLTPTASSSKELFWVINQVKRVKAAGPDNLPIDCYKEMDQHHLQIVLDLINAYWNGESNPIEYTQAQVILLFKKGDKTNLGNYRPISLLNTNYKILAAAILQTRLSTVLDKPLQTSNDT